MRMPRLLHGEFIGRPSGWTPAGEQDHILECPVCGQAFDMRDLGQAFDHWHDGPADDGSGPLAKLKHNLPPVACDRGTKFSSGLWLPDDVAERDRRAWRPTSEKTGRERAPETLE
jgi:hypothetical protein